mgnify:CR=1 FL=1
MLQKVFIVIDFDNDDQKQQVQAELNELSNARVLTGAKLCSMLPLFRKKKKDIFEMFHMIATGGVKSIMSMRGAQLIKNLTSK